MRDADMERVLDPTGKVVGKEPDLPDGDLVAMYEAMLRTRLLDERCIRLQRQGRIGFYGASTGEEAAVVGSARALRETDWIFPALRQSGALLDRGFPLERYFHHLFGNAEAVERGRSMPCHWSDGTYRYVSWSSNIGTQLPQAVGAAYAARYKGDDTVMAAYLGDGASSEGDFHVAMNFAGVWSAPVVFVLQNNHWAISVPASTQTASRTFAVKARAYGFPGVRVDGNDVLAVHTAMAEAVERARSGGGPTLIEAVTYRIESHSTSDDASKYRDQDEVAAWRERDPLTRYRAYLEARGLWDDDREQELRDGMAEEIQDAIERAEAVEEPGIDSLFEDVFAEMPRNLREQREIARRFAGE